FIADSVADRRFIMTLLAVTGFLALLMATAGVYGVTLYTTSRRTQEIGIRTALGATPGRIHRLIFRQAFVTVVIAIVVGLVSLLILMRTLSGLVIGLEDSNPARIAVAVSIVSLTAAVSCWIPVRRATRIDPLT